MPFERFMSNETRKTFEIVCSMNHFVRSTQYGEIFRTTTSVGGVEKIRDVLRVSIPFNPKREALLRDKMGDDANDFYKKFARCQMTSKSADTLALWMLPEMTGLRWKISRRQI